MYAKILIIHPEDDTTDFLKKLSNSIKILHPAITHVFNIHSNDASHDLGLKAIKEHPDNGLIIFLGHGRSDSLYGSKGKYFESRDLASQDAISEHPELYYYKERFIDSSNYDIFRNKKLFCLACNSNLLGKELLKSGVASFIGFGDLPTSKGEFEKEGVENASLHLIAKMKGEITSIMKRSLVHAIEHNYNFQQLFDIIQFVIMQSISRLSLTEDRFKIILIAQLQNISRNMKIYGYRLDPVVIL